MDRLHLVDSLMEHRRREGGEREGKSSRARLFSRFLGNSWIRESPTRPGLKERPTYYSLGVIASKSDFVHRRCTNVKN